MSSKTLVIYEYKALFKIYIAPSAIAGIAISAIIYITTYFIEYYNFFIVAFGPRFTGNTPTGSPRCGNKHGTSGTK